MLRTWTQIGIGLALGALIGCGGTPGQSHLGPGLDAGGGTSGHTGCVDDTDCSASAFCIGGRCGSCRGVSPIQCSPGAVCAASGACIAVGVVTGSTGTSGATGGSGTSGSSGTGAAPCEHRSDCPGAQACLGLPDGHCGAPASDAGCDANDACVKAFICQARACVPGCANDLDCRGTAAPVCVMGNPGHCGPCTATDGCQPGEVCLAGACTPGVTCASGSGCTDGLGCTAGLCGPCVSDGACASGQVCDRGSQRCVPAQTSGASTASTGTAGGASTTASGGAIGSTTGGTLGGASTGTSGASTGSGSSGGSGSTGGSSSASSSTAASSASGATGGSTGGAASALTFSEYLEGESNNKALELYNGTDHPVSLDGYAVRLSSNGVLAVDGGVTATLAFASDAGQLMPGQVLVICNPAFTAAGGICAVTSSVTNFNGDDTLVLYQGSTVVDSIGDGTRPAVGYWGDATTNTLNHDLRRACAVTQGRTAVSAPFDPAAAGWSAFVDTDFSDLGVHACP